MTETSTAAAPVGGTRTLYRHPGEGRFAGVCEGVGRYTNTDPVIWRIVVVVLAVFGGTGAVLYLLAWLLLPKMEPDGTVVESWAGRHAGGVRPALVVLAVVLLIVIGGFDDGEGAAAAAVVAVVAYLVHRERQGKPLVPSYTAPSYTAPSAYAAPSANSPTEAPPWSPPPPYVRVPRERSRLGLVTVSLAALVSGALVWASLAGVEGITPGRGIAVALLIVAGGLVVGTWYGRGRWLIAVGLLLALALGTVVAADATGGTLRGGVGERTWVVSQGATNPTYRLGVGEAVLDLTELPADGPHLVVRGTLGLGHLVVIVPDDVPIRLHATLRIGEMKEFGKSLVSGSDRMERTRTYGPAGDPRVEIEASLGTGQIEVRHG